MNTNNKKTSLIVFQKVRKSFKTAEKQTEVLKDINLTIIKGEYLGIVGKSGSGKSTLLNILTAIDHPTSGDVVINGDVINNLNETQSAIWRGKNIGIIFQFFQLIPTLTISENILLAMEFVNSIPKKDRVKRVDDLLSQVDILSHKDKMPASLSGGEQQRAAIARALANNPDIIVADEPTGNLDSKMSEEIHQLLKEFTSAGKTVIVVSHESNAKERYHRIISLSDGEIINN